MKRLREDDEALAQSSRDSKRLRPSSVDHLSSLSDELLLKVLSFLRISELVVCQR